MRTLLITVLSLNAVDISFYIFHLGQMHSMEFGRHQIDLLWYGWCHLRMEHVHIQA